MSIKLLNIACADPDNSVKGWGGGVLLVLNVFQLVRTDLPRDAIGPLTLEKQFGPFGPNCFSRVVHISISKEATW